MFDLSWTHILMVVVVALVVIGPKDLPIAIRAVGKWIGRAKSLARDFQDSMAELAKEAELDKVKQEFDEFTRYDPGEELKKAAGIDDAELDKILPPEQELDENFEPIPRRTVTSTPLPSSMPSSSPTPPQVDPATAMGPTPPRLASVHVPPTPEAVAAAPSEVARPASGRG
ncbi:MAG: twin-arginine translocase subunit TatB [Alphaproteobacteria bacterium]|nr:twin-arginine translocase subunit TatB [Alphaproteobacteria bacterium]